MEEAPGYWLQPRPVLADVSIWGVSQQMEDLSLSFLLLPLVILPLLL